MVASTLPGVSLTAATSAGLLCRVVSVFGTGLAVMDCTSPAVCGSGTEEAVAVGQEGPVAEVGAVAGRDGLAAATVVCAAAAGPVAPGVWGVSAAVLA